MEQIIFCLIYSFISYLQKKAWITNDEGTKMNTLKADIPIIFYAVMLFGCCLVSLRSIRTSHLIIEFLMSLLDEYNAQNSIFWVHLQYFELFETLTVPKYTKLVQFVS